MSDWQLELTGSFGWGLFDADLHKDKPIYLRPRATVAWDSGPDMLCLTMYLQNHKKLRISTVLSVLHAAQRCMWGGVKENNKNGVLIIGCIITNMPRGHFEGESMRVQLQESCCDFKAKTDKDDALLQFLGPKILQDKGVDPISWDDTAAAEAHDSVDQQMWIQRKPPKVALTQWNTFNDAFAKILPEWHLGLVPAINIGVTDGWFSKEKGGKFTEKLRKIDYKVLEDRNTSAKEAKRRVNMLRDGLKSALRISTYAKLDSEFHEDTFFIVHSNRFLRHFAGRCHKDMRYLSSVGNFFFDILAWKGVFWDSIVKNDEDLLPGESRGAPKDRRRHGV